MANKPNLMPATEKYLAQMGEQIRVARVRRKLSVELVAERAGISRATLWHIEKGSPSVSIGAYAAVLHALNGMDTDILISPPVSAKGADSPLVRGGRILGSARQIHILRGTKH